MQLQEEFDWDPAKAKANLKKHGIAFDTAAFVLADSAGDFHHHEQQDEHHSGREERYITIASHPDDRNLALTIVWTERRAEDHLVTRIVSARFSTTQEKKQYAQYIQQKTRT